jgi:heme exporter protein C
LQDSPVASTIHTYANPLRFQRIADAVYPWTAWGTLVLAPVALYLALAVAPADYQQGDAYRIMFVHVPAAWLGLFFYALMAASALGTLVCLVTGSLWGKPMWGTYWVWDARLTSMLVLLLFYCSIMALWETLDEPSRAARGVSILTLVGAANLPIVKFSVDWWNTLHQPASVFRIGGPTIHPSMLYPLVVMALAFTLIGAALHLAGMRTEILRRRVRTLTILEAERLDLKAA